MAVWGKRSVAVLVAAIVAATGLSAQFAQPALAGPVQPAPSVHLAPLGTLGTANVPLQVSWPSATPDGSPIAHYELQVSRDAGTWTSITLPRPLARSVTTKQPAWAVLIFRVRAVDQASVASDWSESAPVWLEIAQENDPSLTLSAGWHMVTKSAAYGGKRADTTLSGEIATFTYTGRELGWVARLGPNEGNVQVQPDGRDPATISLHRKNATNRRIAFTVTYATSDAHSLTLVTQTASALADIDAFVVLTDPGDATLVGAGDIASCSSTADSDTAAVAAGVPGIVFTAGDNVYPDGAAANYTNCYDPTWGALKTRTRPVPGNHDYENTPGATGYFAYFGAAAGADQTGWYKYDTGTWRVYALSSECTSVSCPLQLAWLKANLAAEPHLCTLAIWHRPRFSTGPHGNSTGVDALWQLLAANSAEIVVNGHDHMYERFTPLDDTGGAAANGLREFVVGTGGAGLYAYKTDSPLIDVRDNNSHGVLRLDLTPGGYSWQFLPSGTATFTDSGTGTCH
jgi:hypothetical protein